MLPKQKLLLLLALVASLTVIPSFSAGAQVVRVFPTRLTIRSGAVSSLPLSVLSTNVAAGTTDPAGSFLTFTPQVQGVLNAVFSFFVGSPSLIDGSAASRIEINFRESTGGINWWSLSVRNTCAGSWVPVQRLTSDTGLAWQTFAVALSLPPECLINPDGRLVLVYKSTSDKGRSLVDSLSFSYRRATPQPTPTPSLSPTVSPTPVSSHWIPRPGTSWQWQLTGTVDTSVNASVFDVDLFDTTSTTIAALHGLGRKVVCYLSAGSYENWRSDAAAFPSSVLGTSLDGWPGERWLDIRKLSVLAPIMGARIDLAKQKGCDGIEPDNVDGYQNNTGFPLTVTDQKAYLAWLADLAHSRSLSVGLKNNSDLVSAMVSNFDYAIVEECVKYNECRAFSPFITANKAVFSAEYEGSLSTVCNTTSPLGFSTIMKNLNLDAWYQACP